MIGPELIAQLGEMSTPTVLNGLRRLGKKPEELEIIARGSVQCMAPELGIRVGFAVTRKVATRTTGPSFAPDPSHAQKVGVDQGVLDVPGPRFLCVENVGDWEGQGCIWGEVTAHINTALGCAAGITNGAVRDIPEMAAAGFMAFAGGAGTGGRYTDFISFNEPVVIGGVLIHSGDLIHGDMHGVIKIPLNMAADIPDAVRAHEAYEQKTFDICRSPEFSLEALAVALKS